MGELSVMATAGQNRDTGATLRITREAPTTLLTLDTTAAPRDTTQETRTPSTRPRQRQLPELATKVKPTEAEPATNTVRPTATSEKVRHIEI